MKNLKSMLMLALCLASASWPLAAQKAVSLGTLLREMTDRSERARFPDPAFTCLQASSTDRHTVAKDRPGWFGNGDCTNFIRTDTTADGREYVMMEAAGPGAVVRFWMTFAGEDSGHGTLRVYIDGNPDPVIEGDARELLAGTALAGAPLAQGLSQRTEPARQGLNLYLPIPYRDGCRITYQSDKIDFSDPGALQSGHEAVFYNINYRCYAPGTRVVSYSAAEHEKNGPLLESVQRQLAGMERRLDGRKLSEVSLDAELAPGGSRTFTIDGERAIRRLSMTLGAANREQALRSTVLEIRFDGERTVWVPVGDFYGIGYRPLYTNTWYMSASPEGRMEAYWVMPFRDGCAITLHNFGTEPVSVRDARAAFSRWRWDDRSMHFGASWHPYSGVSTGRDKDLDFLTTGGPVDLNFVALEGRGVYVGDALALFNSEYVWWGEGDEKIYIDGEDFPSHLGTGSEDYYGYAWGRPETFTGHPFLAQPYGRGATEADYVQNTRLRALDGIPFTSSLVFDMELWHPFRAVVDYAPTTFWYAMPGGRSLIAPDSAGARRPVALRREQIVSPKMKLSVEGEDMILIGKGGDNSFHYQHYGMSYRDIWSNGAHAYWHTSRVGDRLVLGFESVLDDGPLSLTLWCTQMPDYGKVNIYVNGELAAAGVNLQGPRPAVVPVGLGRRAIRNGLNTIAFEMAAFGEGIPAGVIGIDRLEFTR